METFDWNFWDLEPSKCRNPQNSDRVKRLSMQMWQPPGTAGAVAFSTSALALVRENCWDGRWKLLPAKWRTKFEISGPKKIQSSAVCWCFKKGKKIGVSLYAVGVQVAFRSPVNTSYGPMILLLLGGKEVSHFGSSVSSVLFGPVLGTWMPPCTSGCHMKIDSEIWEVLQYVWICFLGDQNDLS